MAHTIPQYAKTLADAARALGRKRSTLSEWARHYGCPCRGRDKTARGYDLRKVRRWAPEHGYSVDEKTGRIVGDLRGHSPKPEADADADGEEKPSVVLRLRTAQADERKAKAELVQLQLEERKGELVSREEVEEEQRKDHLYLRGELLSLPRLGPKLAGLTALEIQAVLKDKVETLMRRFSGEEEQ